ncbi:MAG: hypothetical protein QMD80_03615 [archaeon]|nr:hypothetical protein [archaeon]
MMPGVITQRIGPVRMCPICDEFAPLNKCFSRRNKEKAGYFFYCKSCRITFYYWIPEMSKKRRKDEPWRDYPGCLFCNEPVEIKRDKYDVYYFACYNCSIGVLFRDKQQWEVEEILRKNIPI